MKSYGIMMTIMKIKLIDILCIMFYEHLILIWYYSKIDKNCGRIFDYIKYVLCMCIFWEGVDMLTITLKDKIWYGNAIRKRFHYTHRIRICLKHRWELFYNLHWYLIGFISLFVYYFADTRNIRLVHKLIWNNNVSILGVHKTKRLRFLYWISQLLCIKISV